MFVCRVDTPDGIKDYVTLIPPEIAFSQGLPPEAIVGVLLRLLGPNEPITPQVFAQNRPFVEFMHSVIARYGPQQPGCQAEAKRLGQGWVCIIDRARRRPKDLFRPKTLSDCSRQREGKLCRDRIGPVPSI